MQSFFVFIASYLVMSKLVLTWCNLFLNFQWQWPCLRRRPFGGSHCFVRGNEIVYGSSSSKIFHNVPIKFKRSFKNRDASRLKIIKVELPITGILFRKFLPPLDKFIWTWKVRTIFETECFLTYSWTQISYMYISVGP